MTLHDACTTVSTCDGNAGKKTTESGAVFRRGHRFQKPVRRQVEFQDGTYSSRFRASPTLKLKNCQNSVHHSTSTPFKASGKNPLPPRRRGDRGFTPGSRGTRHGFAPRKFASLQH